MKEFFEGMTSLELTYWGSALIGSAIFLLLFIMNIIGGVDSDMEADSTDFEADDGGIGFQFFTFKNAIAFFTIFGWTGVVCMGNELSSSTTIIISTIAGLAMMVSTAALFFWMNKLAETGTLKIKNAIGNIGEVYLPIGANRSSIGKVQIKVQGSLRELEAITDSDEELASQTLIKVKEVVSAEILLVEKLTK